MDAFISLADAARQMAGEDADSVETWIAVLTAQAEQLHAVKSWTEHWGFLPGGSSYIRQPEEWRIPAFAFNAWRKSNGLERSQNKEDPAERRNRLTKRRAELKQQSVRGFLQVMAQEEGVSVSRIKQYLSDKKPTNNDPDWLSGGKSKRKP